MTRQNKRKWRRLRNQALNCRNRNAMVDTLLALDRAMVELSMHIYNLPACERFVMREQNQRLHDAVRKHLPRLRQPHQNALELHDHAG